ncbi:hypothetical protein GTO27_01955 [Candidatus Bathyarchaeota archaeon]|nr:hypothetical protein [Candidatus Bathyarchaeota archaeon]
MRRIAILITLLIAMFGAMAPFYVGRSDILGRTRYYSPLRLRRFSSYWELKSFIEAERQISPYFRVWLRRSLGATSSTKSTYTGGSLVETYETVFTQEYSRTNVQVEGVDEADIVKTDGEFIYVVSGNSVTIVKVYPAEEAEVSSEIRLEGALGGSFVSRDRLVIIEEHSFRTYIKVYDISDKDRPSTVRNVSLEGHYFNSRMIGDYVYAVINKPVGWLNGEESLPKIYSSNQVDETAASEIYFTDVPDHSYEFTTIVAINTQNDESPSHKTLLVGATHEMYVSLNNVYIALREVERTLIYRVHIEGSAIRCAASGEIPGYVLNQFSMDEHGGYFRIATTTGNVRRNLEEATSRNHVYILDMDLNVIGKLENLAHGEKIYSARFIGDRCYLVTFRKVDPLFVIDLKRPRSPVVLGQLKITGYSDYLHPYDEGHIIGIGKETVAADEEDFAWYQGVKISLFDVSDVEKPREIAKYEIGDRGTDSPVLKDHKALLFERSKNLLVMPVSVAEIDEAKYPDEVPPNARGECIWQGAYVFDVSLDWGIIFKGRISHPRSEDNVWKDGFSSFYDVKRVLYINDVLYTISDNKIKMNSLRDLEEINEVDLSA